MDVPLFSDALVWLQAHQDWIVWMTTLIAFLESLAFFGIVFPGVVMLFATASLAGGCGLELWPQLTGAFVGAVLGDGVSFLLGQKGRESLRKWSFLRKHPEWLSQGESFFQRYGGASIALGRFIGPIRPVIPVVAGMMNMSSSYFYLVNVLSAVVWAVAYVLPGFMVGASIHWREVVPIEMVALFAGVLVCAWCITFVCHLWRDSLSINVSVLVISLLLLAIKLAPSGVGLLTLAKKVENWMLYIHAPLLDEFSAILNVVGLHLIIPAWVALALVWLWRDEGWQKCLTVLVGSVVLIVLMLWFKFPGVGKGIASLHDFVTTFRWFEMGTLLTISTGLFLAHQIVRQAPMRARPWIYWAGLVPGLKIGLVHLYTSTCSLIDLLVAVLLGVLVFNGLQLIVRQKSATTSVVKTLLRGGQVVVATMAVVIFHRYIAF